ncbi:MAG: LysR family transcriptional regulator [Deltaproteobacteria bacterium]|nr:LysR family transcriptional regulator [Deltaproteobacteria bacterium]
MKVGYKIWLEKDGLPVFGEGIYEILGLVEEFGSLHKAAQNLKMSYRAAWGKVRLYEKRLGVELLEKGKHGRTGAHLTEAGKHTLKYYKQLIQEIDSIISSRSISDFISQVDGNPPVK